MAGSSMTFTYEEIAKDSIHKVIADWVSDSTAGTAEGTTTDRKIIGELLKGVTVPGTSTVQPDDNYNVVIKDAEGINVLALSADDLLLRDESNAEEVYFNLSTNLTYPVVAGELTISVAAAGNSNEGQIILYFRR